jgi:hypothetical protein
VLILDAAAASATLFLLNVRQIIGIMLSLQKNRDSRGREHMLSGWKAGVTISLLILGSAAQAASDSPVKIGVLGDQSSVYSAAGGRGSVEAARLAAEDAGLASMSILLEMTVAVDGHRKRNKSAKQGIGGVDVVLVEGRVVGDNRGHGVVVSGNGSAFGGSQRKQPDQMPGMDAGRAGPDDALIPEDVFRSTGQRNGLALWGIGQGSGGVFGWLRNCRQGTCQERDDPRELPFMVLRKPERTTSWVEVDQ